MALLALGQGNSAGPLPMGGPSCCEWMVVVDDEMGSDRAGAGRWLIMMVFHRGSEYFLEPLHDLRITNDEW